MDGYGVAQFLSFLGSFGVFIFGLKKMSESFQKVAGNDLRQILSYITNNSWIGFLSGFTLTGLIQSSSAVTTIIVGVVNAGLINVRQSLGLILGANVGTTITGWLLVLIGYNVKFSQFILPLLGICVPLIFSGVRSWRNVSEILIGFCFLFLGLGMMKEFVPSLEGNHELREFIISISHSGGKSLLLFVCIGVVMTIIVQSSSVAMSLTIVFLSEGWIDFESASALVVGENIGTCATALLASVIGNVDSRRSALAHLLFNVSGVIWVVSIFSYFSHGILWFTEEVLSIKAASTLYYPLALTVFHTAFNLVNSLIFIWFIPQVDKLLGRFYTGSRSITSNKLILGNNIIETPELALLEAKSFILNINTDLQHLFGGVKNQFFKSAEELNEEDVVKLQELEDTIKRKSDETSRFLRNLALSDISLKTSNKIVYLLTVLNEFEKIRIELSNMQHVHKRKLETYTEFRPGLEQGLYHLFDLVGRALDALSDIIDQDKAEGNEIIEKLEVDIIELRDELRVKNMKRLKNKKEGIGTGLIFRDIYSSLAAITDNIYQVQKSLKNQYEISS